VVVPSGEEAVSGRTEFAVDTAGTVTQIETPEPSPEAVAWNRAYDILTATGVAPETAASYALTAQADGKDPVAWAERFVRLSRAARGVRHPPAPVAESPAP
jgi:hypothetical protein